METLQRTANRGSISTGPYEIDNSVKLEADNQEEFIRTPSSASNQKTWTVSMWFKRTEINNYQMLFGCLDTYCYFDTSNNLTINFRGASENFFLITNRLFRDTSAWYHIVVVCDFTNSTAADRGRLYINGVRETSYSNSTYQNAHSGVSSSWNSGSAMAVGGQNGSTTFQSCGYMAEVHGVDGSALTADSFGEFDSDTGIWIPKEYDGSYGTNGFYFKFDSASDMGNDSSGNNNDFSVVNINQSDQATDTPTNNFATFNVLQPRASGTTIAEGGTEMYINSNYQTAVSSIAVSKGKWYAEFIPGSHTAFVGFVDVTEWTIPQLHNGFWLGYDGTGNTMSVSMKGTDGTIYNESNSATGATYGNTDVVSVALDMDNRKAYFAVNGTWVNSGNPATEANPILWYTQRADGTPWTDVITMGITGYTNTYHRCNFGGYTSASISSGNADSSGYGNFEYAVPSGYYSLCSRNLSEHG